MVSTHRGITGPRLTREFPGPAKTHLLTRGSRAALAAPAERALQELFEKSAYRAPDDLVFPHPQLGTVLDPSRLRRRFKRALIEAGLRELRFRDLRHTRAPFDERRPGVAIRLSIEPGLDRVVAVIV